MYIEGATQAFNEVSENILEFTTAEENYALLGGKGSNLARLTQAGFSVPTGFCVTTDAYQQHMVSSGLDNRIPPILKEIDYGDAESVERRSAEIRYLIVNADIQESLSYQITKAYSSITDRAYVAVRSSGTAEDLQDASFAGLHDTYLDIKGEDQLLDAIRRCWASLWTARAIAYRQSRGFDHAAASLSVVVQEMIAADASGVMFTANPMNAQTDEITVNASWGLGEAIVSGIVTPDEVIVSSDQLEILERRLGSKELRIDRIESGGTSTTDVPEADRSRYALTDPQTRELAQLGLRVQDYYQGFPQDIEWALCNDQFFVLQSRPVTGVEFSWDNDHALVDLMTGVPQRTVTMEENYRLWQLSEKIRHSPELNDLFNKHQGADFPAALQRSERGRGFLGEYRDFLRMYGCRGHQDRDMYFPRRSEDPAIDYRSLKAMLSVEQSQDPEAKEHQTNALREKVLEEIVHNIRKKIFGSVLGKLFVYVHAYALKFIMTRDNERMIADVTTMAIKQGFLEVSRRLMERRVLTDPRDFYFLTRDELYDLLDGQTNNPALKEAKISARKRNFDSYLNKTRKPGPYLRRGQELDLDIASSIEEDGSLRGAGTSRGKVSGTARVVHSLEEIGRVQEGEILICHATDPGWTPVFIVIAGLVLETGGVLAHGSCLSREYGLPCVQLANATELIPDGANVTLDGDTGLVKVDE
ncbi:MAG: PEP-utilizing enzyme [Candidatus Tectomicrobia bacterium]|nr:PEP-utilizing enzyme [Candidatus Tectomicrobia bacterium]